jgi:hypothetical protein
METVVPRLKLKFTGDAEYILINGDDSRSEGAIATEEEYENFELNKFHLFEDGSIMSYGSVVGTKDDIIWLN